MGKNKDHTSVDQPVCIVALGSNLGVDKSASSDVLTSAFVRLETAGLAIRARSRFFRSPAFPAGSGPDFVNAAAVIETLLTPQSVLERLHAIEAELGRERTVRWGPRTLDIDLIACGAQVLPSIKVHDYWRELPLEKQQLQTPGELILPHPRLAERAFVLVPLAEVAPDWCHPLTGKSVRQMHDALPLRLLEEVVAL